MDDPHAQTGAGAGHAPDGTPRARLTSKDIARLAGVSQATVSNAINRPHLLAEQTRTQVLELMRRSGYVVNNSARALKAGVGQALGVVVLDVTNPFWGEVIQGVESVTGPQQTPLLIGSSNEDAPTERRILESFEAQRVRGILIAPTHANLPLLRSLRAQGTRVVLLDRDDPEGGFPSLSLDHAAGAALAAQHLRAAGHRRVALVNGTHQISWCASRSRGFQAAWGRPRTGGVHEVHELQMQAMTLDQGLQAVPRLLALRPRVTAVFCANDMLALGVLKGLAQHGVAVPQQLSVVGYDDMVFAELLAPALTTVRQPARAIGRAAAQLLSAPPGAGAAPQALPAPVLVVRASVGAPADG